MPAGLAYRSIGAGGAPSEYYSCEPHESPLHFRKEQYKTKAQCEKEPPGEVCVGIRSRCSRRDTHQVAELMPNWVQPKRMRIDVHARQFKWQGTSRSQVRGQHCADKEYYGDEQLQPSFRSRIHVTQPLLQECSAVNMI